MLVVVHPGSACGYADFNLGLIEGAIARERLTRTIMRWGEQIIVIDGELSDELKTYAQLGLALENARSAQRLQRIDADAEQPQWAQYAAGHISRRATSKRIMLTGAWHHPSDRQGCIDHLQSVLANDHGIKAEIMPCSLTL